MYVKGLAPIGSLCSVCVVPFELLCRVAVGVTDFKVIVFHVGGLSEHTIRRGICVLNAAHNAPCQSHPSEQEAARLDVT
jgi:hypothetical protein